MGPTNRRGYCLPKYHHHDLHHLHHFNCECTTRGSCIRVLSKTTTHAGRSTPHSGRRSRGTAIHRAATQVGDHRNRHTVTFSKGGNTTLRKRLAVGGGTAVGQRRNQREAATPLTAPMLASALVIATSSVAAVAATPVETLRSLHLCRSRDSATHRCGARNHGQVTAAAISSMCPQQLGTPTLHTGSLSPLEHRWNQLCARTSHPNFNGLNPARAC